MVLGASLVSGAAAGIVAEPTWQNIYVDGQQVSMTAYNIAGNNYVKLRDIGQQVGFNVYWDNGVQIDSDAPYTGIAPVQATQVLPTIDEIREEMIERINQVRREHGVSELIVNQSLMNAAQECSSRHYTSHHNREECEAVANAGYPHGFGSNLTVLVGTGISRIAEKAVTNWENSSGHLETMVDADYEEVGVGVTIDNGRIFCYMFAGAPGTYNPYG
jgi:hypothetical protein